MRAHFPLLLSLFLCLAAWGCQRHGALDAWQQDVDEQHLSPQPIRLAFNEAPVWYTAVETVAGPGRLVAVGGSPALTSLDEALAAAQNQALSSAHRQMQRLLAEAQNRLVHAEIRVGEVVVVPVPGRSALAVSLPDWPTRIYDGDPATLPQRLPRHPPDLFAEVGRDPRERFRVAAWAISERQGDRLYAYCRVEMPAEQAKQDLVAALLATWTRHTGIDNAPQEVVAAIAQTVEAVWQEVEARR